MVSKSCRSSCSTSPSHAGNRTRAHSYSPGATPPADWFAHWSLLGAPLDGRGAPALPGANEELATLAELHPDSQRISGAAFDRAHVMQALEQSRAIHIATHLLPTCAGES